MKKIFFIILGIYSNFLFSQLYDSMYTPSGYLKIKFNKDSVAYTKDYFFNEGIYLSYEDFRKCIAVPRSLILSRLEKNQLEFYHKLVLQQDTIVYRNGLGINIIFTDDLFCFVQNNIVYINVEGTFCRIPVFGNISHFIGTISSEAFKDEGPFYEPGFAGGGSSITGNPLKSKETREFLFDFYTGKTMVANPENMLEVIRRDSILFSEYSKLSKNQRRKKMYYYLKQYNERHSAFFPKA